jgi:hypothetical protein
VEKLYSGYRGDVYFRERHAVEPWYSKKVNDGIGGDLNEIHERNSALETFLSPHLEMRSIGSVLDYGGDRGQFIPTPLGKQKFVFELSDATPVEQVGLIRSAAELEGQHFDFIMACGVLEHLSEPLQTLQTLASLTKGPESLLHISVPYERFGLKWLGTGRLYRAYLELLRRSGPLLTLVDFYSSACRVRLEAIPPLGIAKCHEHLNFFNENSMASLLRRAGMDMIACSIVRANAYPVPTPALYVLARPNRS